MKKYIKYFALVGFIAGIIHGVGITLYSYFIAPSIPGIMEVIVQLLIAVALGILYSFYGFLLWLVCFIAEKLYIKIFKHS